MFKLIVAILVSAWLSGAQDTDNDAYHPHGAFAFIRTGERTPNIWPGVPLLTALGAHQMFSLGQNLRARYINGNVSDTLGVQRIAGMSRDTLDNNQILVQTLDQQHLVSSAQAFMQGLYPPHTIGSSNGTGSSLGDLLSNGSAIDFPLGGYQYANIQTSGVLDPESIYISGTQSCPIAAKAAMTYYTTSKFMETKTANSEFYQKLNLDWFEGNLKQSQLDYTYATQINDCLQYQYAHNTSIYQALADSSPNVFAKVRTLADESAWYTYGNTSTSLPNAQATSGKTLAANILSSFKALIADKSYPGDQSDMSYPLTLTFGESDPMIALTSLMAADFHDEYFRAIPAFGSAMIFELFSRGPNATFPASTKDLWVRFYFHNGTEAAADQLTAFPIFGNGPSRTDVGWTVFAEKFGGIGVQTVREWCEECASPSLFCAGVEGGTGELVLPSRAKQSAISPAVGGVIGATVTLVVAGVLFGLAMLLGGVRLHRVQRSKQSELGGFKGSRKLASDPDLSLASKGAPPAGISFVPDSKRGHERVGSWELRQKEYGGARERESFDAIDAVAKPVLPDERV